MESGIPQFTIDWEKVNPGYLAPAVLAELLAALENEDRRKIGTARLLRTVVAEAVKIGLFVKSMRTLGTPQLPRDFEELGERKDVSPYQKWINDALKIVTGEADQLEDAIREDMGTELTFGATAAIILALQAIG